MQKRDEVLSSKQRVGKKETFGRWKCTLKVVRTGRDFWYLFTKQSWSSPRRWSIAVRGRRQWNAEAEAELTLPGSQASAQPPPTFLPSYSFRVRPSVGGAVAFFSTYLPTRPFNFSSLSPPRCCAVTVVAVVAVVAAAHCSSWQATPPQSWPRSNAPGLVPSSSSARTFLR